MKTAAHIDQFKYTSGNVKGREGEFEETDLLLCLQTVRAAFSNVNFYDKAKDITEDEKEKLELEKTVEEIMSNLESQAQCISEGIIQ